MLAFPHCKINLGLRVLAKRPDGYHQIETVMYPVPMTDALELLESKKTAAGKLKFDSYGLNIPGKPEENLCLKAYRMLDEEFDLPPVHMILQKHIPMGAGLGGGSSDAAFSLRMLNEKFSLGLNRKQLQQYAARLGSDCAFFTGDQPALASGRGERLKAVQLDLSGLYLLLIHPGIHVSTKEAYEGLQRSVSGRAPEKAPGLPFTDIISKPPRQWKGKLLNDFESSVFRSYPAIGEIRNELYRMGALYASMSGSGSAVYGLFEEPLRLPLAWKKMKSWMNRL